MAGSVERYRVVLAKEARVSSFRDCEELIVEKGSGRIDVELKSRVVEQESVEGDRALQVVDGKPG